MRFWTISLLSALGLTLLWLLSPGRSASVSEPGVVEISYMAPSGPTAGPLADAMRVFEQESRERHARDPAKPVYRVILGETASNDASGDPTRFLVSVAGGEPPDVISFDRFAVSEWAARGAFEPLDGYLATAVGQFMWSEHVLATDNALFHKLSPAAALDRATANTQRELDRVLAPPPGRPVRWSVFPWVYGLIVLATGASVYLWDTRWRGGNPVEGTRGGNFRSQWIGGWVCASPWIVGFVVFTGGPVLFSVVVSFCEYDVLNPARLTGSATTRGCSVAIRCSGRPWEPRSRPTGNCSVNVCTSCRKRRARRCVRRTSTREFSARWTARRWRVPSP